MQRKWNKRLQKIYLSILSDNHKAKNGKYIKRGIVQFLPYSKVYIREFKYFIFNSWLNTCTQRNNLKNQPCKTDLIVFTPIGNKLPKLCTEIKINKNGDYYFTCGYESPISKCYWIQTREVNQKYWNYIFTDNLLYLGNNKNLKFLDSYDYIFKTESDTFLTKKFSNWVPNIFSVGRGQYANDDSVKYNIRRVARIMNNSLYNLVKNKWVHNIGAALYGNPKLIVNIHIIAIKVLKYLLNNDFLNKTGKWPGWYRGVSSMYALEIGVNFQLFNGKFDYNNNELDHISTDGYITETAHVHCWHTDKLFSKFRYRETGYVELNNKELNIQYIPHYCLSMVLNKFDKSDIITDGNAFAVKEYGNEWWNFKKIF